MNEQDILNQTPHESIEELIECEFCVYGGENNE